MNRKVKEEREITVEGTEITGGVIEMIGEATEMIGGVIGIEMIAGVTEIEMIGGMTEIEMIGGMTEIEMTEEATGMIGEMTGGRKEDGLAVIAAMYGMTATVTLKMAKKVM